MRPALGWICAIFAFVCGIAIIVPFAPTMPRLDLDGSWPLAINVAAFRHLVFGRDVVFTAGPLSAIYTRQYFPGMDTKVILGAIGLAVATMTALLSAVPAARRPWLVLLPIVMTLYGMTDMIFLLMPWLLVVIAAHQQRPRSFDIVATHLLVSACALLPLIKGSATVSSVICVGLCALVLGRMKRAYLVSIPLTFVFFMALTWKLSGQALHDLPTYFISQSAVIAGYGDAMNVQGPDEEVWMFVASGLTLLLCCASLTLSTKIPILAATALTLLISFKAGMIRHDGHASFAACALIVVGIYLYFAVRRWWRYAALLAGLIPGLIIISHYVDVSPAAMVSRLQNTVAVQVDGAVERLSGRARLNEEYAKAVAGIRESVPIEGDGRTADLFPSDASALILSNDQWMPRPSLQSYAAYTPELIRRNVEHLRAAPPDRIYFRIDTIDHRYASMDDAASWPWILATYRPLNKVGDYLVLERHGPPVSLPVGKPTMTRSVRIGESVGLRRGEPLWATIKLKPSFAGKMLGILFKRPVVTLRLRFANGMGDSYRIVPGMTETGFLLSPTIRSSGDFLALWTGNPSASQAGSVPVSMQIELPEGGSPWWEPTYELSISPFPIPAVAKPEPKPDPITASATSFESGGQCNIEKLDGIDIPGDRVSPDGKSVTFTGWAAISASMGIPNASVSLLLQGADGKRLLVAARKSQRGDVAAAFRHESISNSGYEATVDTSKVSLPARVSVVQTLSGASIECAQRTVLLVPRT